MKVSAREKRILYAGILMAVLILIYYAATEFSPGDGASLAERVETQERLLSRQRELIGRKEFYEKRIEEAENDLVKIQTRLLPGNNIDGAGTELQRILTGLANQSGVEIRTKSNMPQEKVVDNDTLIKISVQLGIDCTIEDLVDFLTAIRNYDKFLKVERMTIQTQTSQRQMTIRRPLNMVVVGYISAQPPSEHAAKPGENLDQAASAARETMKR